MRSHFGILVEERCAALGIKSQVALRALLLRAGVRVSATTVSAWHTGSMRPRPGRLAALLDVLDIHGPDRDRAYRLAGEVPVEDGEAGESSPLS